MSKFNAHQWILKATGNDPSRPMLDRVWYDKAENCLVATNGGRMHVWKNPPCDHLTESTYVEIVPKSGLIVAVKGDWQFPNWTRVIPQGDALTETIEYDFVDWDRSIPIFCVKYGVALNCTYLKDLGDMGWSVRFSKEEP